MTINAVLSASTMAASPGQDAGCDVQVTNGGCERVTVDLRLSGPAAGWAVVVPASLVVRPGVPARARVVVEIPRANDLAGTERALMIGVVARDSSAPPVELAGRVTVAESQEMRATITPLVARARGAATYTVTIANLGTGRRRVDLSIAEDVQLGMRLAPAQLEIPAGESATAELTVRPRRAEAFGPVRPHRIVVRAEPDAGRSLTAAATHFQELRRWRVPAAIAAAGVAVAGLLSVAASGSRPLAPVAGGPAISTIAASTCPEAVAGGPARVAVADFAYCPEPLTVAAGTEVVWANADLSPHTATFDGPEDPFDSGLLARGGEWSRRFDRVGTYQYYCRLHPGMTGTIVVT